MGHYLKAFIGKRNNLIDLCIYENARIVDLDAMFDMIPITDELFDEINQNVESPSISSFECLTVNVEQKILHLIKDKELAYVESEFFGGRGGHIGVVWEHGSRVLETAFHMDSMNMVLRKLGVKRVGNKDEFLTLRLDKYRNTEDWLD